MADAKTPAPEEKPPVDIEKILTGVQLAYGVLQTLAGLIKRANNAKATVFVDKASTLLEVLIADLKDGFDLDEEAAADVEKLIADLDAVASPHREYFDAQADRIAALHARWNAK